MAQAHPLDDLEITFGIHGPAGRGPGLRALLEPIVHLGTGRVEARELLVRPRSGISLVELDRRVGSRLLAHLTGSVLQVAGRVLAQHATPLHVNVTARDLERPGFADEVLAAVPDPARRSLVLEVTEQFPITDEGAATTTVAALRQAGVRFAVDDFGEGWSNLRSLLLLCPEVVKVTIDVFGGDARGDALAEWVVGTARSFGARTVVEQVERPEQEAWARDRGFDAGQGWLWGSPADR